MIETVEATQVIIDNSLFDVTDEYGPSPATVFTTDLIGYTFYIDNAAQDLAYSKSSDGGVTWGAPVVINTVISGWTTVAVWYDQWTPGDTTGTKIHIAAADDAADDIFYTFLDTNGDSLKGSMVTAVSGTTTYTESTDGPPSITKGAGGALFISGNFTSTAGGKVSKSTDGAGDTWTDITPSSWSSAAIDQVQLLPLLTDNDIIAIRADTGNNDIDSRIYDEVADTWAGSWTSIGTLTENTTYDQWFSGAIKKSTGDVYLTFANQTNNAANDVEFWTLTDGGRTWAQGTNVMTDSATTMMPVPVVNETTGDIYVAYLRGTLGSAMHVYFKETTDGGASWGGEIQLSGGTTRHIIAMKGSMLHATRPYVTFYDDTANDVYGTTVLGNIEVIVDETILDATDEYNPSPATVFTTDQIGYVFYIDGVTQDLAYRKTGDGGKTWGNVVVIDTAVTGWTTLAVWYDQWTPGDTTGTKIHIAAVDDASADIFYTFLDTNGDSLKGSVVTAVSGTTTFTESATGPPSITKGAGGALFISGNFVNTAGGKVSKSTDGAGDSWSDITPASWSSVAIDQVQLLPLLTDNDIIAIRADTNNNDIDSRIYDEVADTWAGSWTSIGGLIEQNTLDQWFSASIKKSTGNVYLSFANAAGAGTNDIEFWTLTDSGRTWTRNTDVITDSATVTAPVPVIDESTGNIHVAYLRGTLNTTMSAYYKVSVDGGTTWSSESATIGPAIADDFKSLRGNLLSTVRLFVIWYNDDLNQFYGATIPFEEAPPVTVTGTVYSNEGTTVIGAGKLVSYSVNGGAITDTATTDAGGQFTLSGATMTGGSIVTLFLDGNTEKGVTVTLGSGSSMTGMHIYQNRLIVRSDSGATSLTNTHLDVADNAADDDISAIYSINSSVLNVKSGKALTVWAGDSFSPGAAVNVGSGVTINGNFAMGANSVTLSGSWLTQGAGAFTGTNDVIFDGSSGSKTITSNGSSFSGVQIIAGGTYTLADTLDLNGNFVSSGSPTFDTNNQTVNVDGNFTVGAGTLTLGSSTLTVAGNLNYTSLSTLNKGTSTVVMTGTGKTVAGNSSSAIGFYNFTISGGVTITTYAIRPFGTLLLQPNTWLASPLSIVLADPAADLRVMTGALIDGASGIVMNSGSSISQQFGKITAPVAVLGQHIGEGNRIAAGTYDGDVTAFGISGQLATLELSPGTTTMKGILDLTAFGVGAVLKNDVTNASLVLEGDVAHTQFNAAVSWLKGNGTITFSGSSAQSFMTSGNALEDIIVNKSGDSVSPSDGLTTDSITVNAGTFDQNSQTVDSNGSLTINGGTYDNGEGLLLLAGDLLNEGGTFISDTGTVELDGTSQTLSGSNMFYNLKKYVTTPRTLTLQANSVQSISGSLALSGATSNLLSIRSTVTDTQAKFNVDESATHDLQFLDVRDNNAIGVELQCLTASGCVNSENNTNWDFGIVTSITGKVYSDEGETEIGSDITVAVSLNGGSVSLSDTTDGNGYYSIANVEMTGGTIITLFLNGETEKAVTVTLGSGSSMTGIDLYQDRLIVRSDSGSVALTNAHLAVADNSADSDITDIYTMDSSTLQVAAGKSLTVWEGDTFTPGGEIDAGGSITIDGTLTLGSNDVAVAGGWLTNAGGSFTTAALVTFDGNDGATYQITSDGSWFSDLTFAAGSSTTYQLGDDLVVGGSFTTEAGDYHFSANGNDGDVAFDVTLANDTVTLGGTWYVGGNWDHSAISTLNAGTSTVIMNGVGGTIVGSYQVSVDFYNLTINDSMTINSDTADDVDARLGILNVLTVNTGATLAHSAVQGSEDVGIAMYLGSSDVVVYEDASIAGAGELMIYSGASISKNDGEISPSFTAMLGDHVGDGNRIAAGTYGSVGILDIASTQDTVEFSAGTTTINGLFIYGSLGNGTVVDNSVTNSSFIITGDFILTDYILGSGKNLQWTKGNGTITFNGSDASMNVIGQAMEDMIIDKSSGQTLLLTSTGSTDGVTVNGGIFSQSTHPFDVNGSITINAGTFTTNGQSLNLSGDLLNEGGTFTATGGTVTLDGTNQTLSGSNLFYNLTKIVTSPRTLTLAANTVQSVSGALVLQGEEDNLLSIRSTQTGVQATINLDEDGTQTIDYLDVRDSNAGGEELVCIISTEGCENSLNNTNWDFGVVDEENEDDFFFFFGQ